MRTLLISLLIFTPLALAAFEFRNNVLKPESKASSELMLPLSPPASQRPESQPATAAPSPTSLPHPSRPPNSVRISNAAKTGPHIEFINLPAIIPAGNNFDVRWQINGPSGLAGTNAKIIITSHSQQSTGNSRSSSNVSSTQSFGSFTTPATFTSQFSFDTPGQTLIVTASAQVNGKEISTEKIIKLD